METPSAIDNTSLVVEADTLLELQASVLSIAHFDAASGYLATRLADLLGCDRISIGFVADGCAEVIAISHGAALEARQELNRDVSAAMDEAIDQAASICFPSPPTGRPRITLAHAELARRNGGSVCSVPIASMGRVAGALTIERSNPTPLSSHQIAACEQVVSLVGPVLILKRESERSWWARTREALRGARAKLLGPGELASKSIALGAVLAFVGLVLVPLPYHVSAPARLEGAIQRALVAPADSFLQQVSVRPGDAVKAGQVLAELTQQDLQLERTKRESELAQHENSYGATLALSDRAALMVNHARMAEARAQLELVEKQIERASIKAPFDGIVISGDLSQSLGAPTQRGQVLMVIAPKDRYRLIVEVDERDIADVKLGAGGRISLAAFPGETIAFRTERMNPVAVTREGRHFFEVEGKPEASQMTLRPGLQGFAKIDAESQSLFWSLGSRLFTWTRLMIWKWTN